MITPMSIFVDIAIHSKIFVDNTIPHKAHSVCFLFCFVFPFKSFSSSSLGKGQTLSTMQMPILNLKKKR